MDNELKSAVEEWSAEVPIDYIDQGHRREEKIQEDSSMDENIEMYEISTFADLALYEFTESLRKSLGLELAQVFDWNSYLKSGVPELDFLKETELFKNYFQLPGFVVQFCLLLIRPSGSLLNLYEYLLNFEARQQLVNLVEILWSELAVNRGSAYMAKDAVKLNQKRKQDIYLYFKQRTSFPPSKIYNTKYVFPLRKTEPKENRELDPNGYFCAMVAQACFLTYSQAFTPSLNKSVLSCFESKIESAANTVLGLLNNNNKNKDTLERIFNNNDAMVLFARLISHYYAEKQVSSATSAINKEMATIRQQETRQLIPWLTNLLQKT